MGTEKKARVHTNATSHKGILTWHFQLNQKTVFQKFCRALIECTWSQLLTHMKSVTHLHEWQFFKLAKKLKDSILCPQQWNNATRPVVPCKPPKFDHYHVFTLSRCQLCKVFYPWRPGMCLYVEVLEGPDEHLSWPMIFSDVSWL